MAYDLKNIKIEPVAQEELVVVSRLAERIWPDAYREILTDGQIRYMLAMMYDPSVLEREHRDGICFDLIRDGEMPIGFVSYGSCRQHPNGECAKLHKIYLDSAWHNRGVGTMALRYVIDEVRGKGYELLRLNVNRKNTAAIRAYERNGFRKEKEVVTDIGGGYLMDDFIMALDL